ncbi:unnamed protein product, partial [Amoebophrya sp. A120]|eukprot:GSA120T00017579001.1
MLQGAGVFSAGDTSLANQVCSDQSHFNDIADLSGPTAEELATTADGADTACPGEEDPFRVKLRIDTVPYTVTLPLLPEAVSSSNASRVTVYWGVPGSGPNVTRDATANSGTAVAATTSFSYTYE